MSLLWVLVLAACAACSLAQTCSTTDPILNTPSTCCPVSGKTCTAIEYSDIQSSEVCHWTNLVQQTAEFRASDNYDYQNTFPCVGAWCLPSADFKTNEIPSTATQKYYAQIDTGENGSSACTSADDSYKAFNQALSKYNCETDYSHWTCNDCRKAYARWAAAISLPACAISSDGSCTAIKPCIRLCNEVVQKCPITLGFRCPEGGEGDQKADYAKRGTPYCTTFKYDELSGPSPLQSSGGLYYTTSTTPTPASFRTDCCNSMGLQSTAVSTQISFVTCMIAMAGWVLAGYAA